MSRWKVKRVRLRTGGWGEWAACNDDEPTRHFLTWREAMDYADRQARTREVVLPRPNLDENEKVEFDFTEWAGLDYWPWIPEGAMYDRRTGRTYRFGEEDLFIRREHWKPLALALLALADQEEA